MKADEYKARAAELRSQAAEARDAEVRKQFLLMAADWEKLAADAQRGEPTPPGPPPPKPPRT